MTLDRRNFLLAGIGGTIFSREMIGSAMAQSWETNLNLGWKQFWQRARSKNVLVLDARWEGEKDGQVPSGIKTMSVMHDPDIGLLDDNNLSKIKSHKGDIFVFCKGNVRAPKLAEYLSKEQGVKANFIMLEGGMDNDPQKLENRKENLTENNGGVEVKIAER